MTRPYLLWICHNLGHYIIKEHLNLYGITCNPSHPSIFTRLSLQPSALCEKKMVRLNPIFFPLPLLLEKSGTTNPSLFKAVQRSPHAPITYAIRGHDFQKERTALMSNVIRIFPLGDYCWKSIEESSMMSKSIHPSRLKSNSKLIKPVILVTTPPPQISATNL